MADITPVHPSEVSNATLGAASKPLTFPFWRFAMLLLALVVLIGILGYLSYKRQVTAGEEAAYRQIEAIGSLKADQLAQWLKERRGDASILFNSQLGVGLQAFLADPTSLGEQKQIHLSWLHSLINSYDYSAIALLDAKGDTVLATADIDLDLEPKARAFIEQALDTRQVVFSDLYQAKTAQAVAAIRLDFVVPLLIDRDRDVLPTGALLLRIDPYDHLYPLLQRWPVPSHTAETLLVRQEDTNVVYLTPLRHRPDEPLSLRLPLNTPNLPDAKALQGETGEVSGRDYRGEPVLAALRAIPDVPWYLVAKIDQQEVREPLRHKLIQTLLITSLFIAAMGLLGWGYWRRYNEDLVRRTNRFLESRIEARTTELRESEMRLRLALEASSVGLWDWDLITNAVYFSPEWKRQIGYEDHEIPNRFEEWKQRLHPQDRDRSIEKTFDYIKNPWPNFENEFRLRHKDGSYRWILVRATLLTDGHGKPVRMLGSHTDITERKTYETQLEFQANYDSLTKLPNRNLLQDRLQHAIAQARRADQTLGILFVDLDRFKLVNDSLGHAMGDSLLKMVAERLKDCVRESDTVARLGGDEFVILLENLPQPGLAKLIADKVLDTTKTPYALDGHDFFIGASVGISLFPRDGNDGQALLKNADIAMQRAKEQGRHRVEFYSPELNELVLRRVALENGLRKALSNEELELHYQPQADLRSGRITGVEALLRWRHPELGIISPAEFIPLAEESGLIITMGEWVLRTACAQLKAWQEAGLPKLTVGVNLSARQFLEAGLVETVASILEETGLGSSHLELEIAESLLMQDVESTIATLQSLKTMGVRLAVDDFGTGYSSLAYLKRFPLDRLKIDQSFVQDITIDPNDTAITLAVIALAHSLRLQAIAEGMESEAQLAFLRDNDCDAAQGYFLSRPLLADELSDFLQQPLPWRR